MYKIKVELPHVRDRISFKSVKGWVSRKGERHRGLSTLIQPWREDPSVVIFDTHKRAQVWARKNIWDPKAKVIIVDATIPKIDDLEDSLWKHQARWI